METIAFLGRANREGLVGNLQPLLERLMNSGIHFRKDLVDAALKEASKKCQAQLALSFKPAERKRKKCKK